MESEDKFDVTKFEIVKKIGSGSFGEVYIVNYLPTSKKYALKSIDKELMHKYDYNYLLQAYYRELECMIKCNCQNSVKFYKQIESEKNLNNNGIM